MIIVIHGDDQAASRRRLSDIRDNYQNKGWEIMNVAKGATQEEVDLSSRSQNLLGQEIIVVAEEFFTNKKSAGQISHLTSGNIVFWESRELPKTLLNSFPKDWKIENFTIPQSTFKFLDALAPGAPQNALRFLHDMEDEDAFGLVPLMSWHTRYLIWAREEPKTLNMPSWRSGKLIAQASKFELDKLYDLHEKLLVLDRSVKTGTNVLPPLASLELLIANL